MNIFAKIINFIKESRTELKKVKWPTRHEALQYTVIVIIISLAVALYLGSLDFIFTQILKRFFF